MSHARLLGSVQIRIRYHYQQPSDIDLPDPKTLLERARKYSYNYASSEDESTSRQDWPVSTPAIRRVSTRPNIDHPFPNEDDDNDSNSDSNNNSSKEFMSLSYASSGTAVPPRTDSPGASQHGRGELARDENYVDLVFRDRLTTIMSTNVEKDPNEPRSEKRASKHRRQRVVPSQRQQSKVNTTCRRFQQFIWPKKLKSSSRGKRYGFSQNDSDDSFRGVPSDKPEKEEKEDENKQPRRRRDRIRQGARRQARHIIHSVNFGDKNFASQWMKDSFDEVALSHPVIDHLIGMVVSSQTQALVRSIIKMANAFVSWK